MCKFVCACECACTRAWSHTCALVRMRARVFAWKRVCAPCVYALPDMYVCVCIFTFMCACERACTHVYIYVRIYTCECACVRLCTHIHVCVACVCVWTHVFVHVTVHVHVYVRICASVWAFVRACTHVFACSLIGDDCVMLLTCCVGEECYSITGSELVFLPS